MSVVYGTKSLKSSEDENIKQLERFLDRSLKAGSGDHWVEYIHWMEHIPAWMAKWKREAEAWFHKDTDMFKKFWDDVLARQVQ